MGGDCQCTVMCRGALDLASCHRVADEIAHAHVVRTLSASSCLRPSEKAIFSPGSGSVSQRGLFCDVSCRDGDETCSLDTTSGFTICSGPHAEMATRRAAPQQCRGLASSRQDTK